MEKSKLNLLIDALMFLAMAAIGGIGFLMKWVLPPGPDRLARYGRSVEMSWLGMDRHQFGTIHLYIAIVLLGLLVLHIVLHWRQILAIYRRLVSNNESRWAIATLFSIVCAALLAFPLFVKPEVTEAGGEHGHGRLHEASMTGSGIELVGHSAPEANSPVRGRANRLSCAECDASGPNPTAYQAHDGDHNRGGNRTPSVCDGCPGCQ